MAFIRKHVWELHYVTLRYCSKNDNCSYVGTSDCSLYFTKLANTGQNTHVITT